MKVQIENKNEVAERKPSNGLKSQLYSTTLFSFPLKLEMDEIIIELLGNLLQQLM